MPPTERNVFLTQKTEKMNKISSQLHYFDGKLPHIFKIFEKKHVREKMNARQLFLLIELFHIPSWFFYQLEDDQIT